MSTALMPVPTAVGQAANQAASHTVFTDYISRQAKNTIRTQQAALVVFSDFLYQVSGSQVTGLDLQQRPAAWRGITWGLVEAFQKWLLNQGYSVATVNGRVTAVKVYAGLAAKAGTIPPDEHILIRAVQGYSRKEAERVNERRPTQRVGEKKATHTPITAVQAQQLKANHPPTPQGARNRLLLALLLDLGLRCSEVINIIVEGIDLHEETLTFYRQKVSKTQTHRLSADLLTAVTAYLPYAPKNGRLFLGNARKKGELSQRPLGVRTLFRIVRRCGELHDLPALSPHDCRHHWATQAARAGTDPFALQEAGGWASLDMPRRYIEDAAIANEGVKL